MNTWKQKTQLTQADLTHGASSGPTPDPALVTRYLQEAAAGEQSRSLDLDQQMRGRMERQFGLDFSAVRLAESNLPGKLGANAVAQGDLIRFAPNAFHPETSQGERLLSHELAHLVQQRRMAPSDGAGLPLYDATLERGADAIAARAGAGETAGPLQPFSPVPADKAPMQGNKILEFFKNLFGGGCCGGQEPLDDEPPPRNTVPRNTASNQSTTSLTASNQSTIVPVSQRTTVLNSQNAPPPAPQQQEFDNKVKAIRQELNPFDYIKAEMQAHATGQKSLTSYAFNDPCDIDMTNQDPNNPTRNPYLGALYMDLDEAQDLQTLERVFRKYTSDVNPDSMVGKATSDGSKALADSAPNIDIDIDTMREVFKQMSRIMLDFPGLKLGRLGVRNLDEPSVKENLRYGTSYANVYTGEVVFSSAYFGNGEADQNISNTKSPQEKRADNGQKAQTSMQHNRPYTGTPYIGVHEMGHVINGHLAKAKLKNNSNSAQPIDKDSVTKEKGNIASEITGKAVTTVQLKNEPVTPRQQLPLQKPLQKQIENLLTQPTPQPIPQPIEQLLRQLQQRQQPQQQQQLLLQLQQELQQQPQPQQQLVELQQQLQRQLLLQQLYTERQTSKHGASNPAEMFAEALSDVYTRGKDASKLNRKIVSLMRQSYMGLRMP